jgi:hypothetical protein
MPSKTLTLLSAVAMATFASALHAGHSHHLGRHLGVGWGDGYHARTACPPKRHFMHAAPPPAASLPWWMIPAEGTETLPKVMPQEQLPGPDAATGPTLFRQPGEGSSVHPHSAPSIMR